MTTAQSKARRDPAPETGDELVERFVRESRSKSPELIRAGLSIALDLVDSWEAFVEGGWICLVGVHVYVHSDRPGLGELRVLGMVERFVRWLRREGYLEAWDEQRLVALINAARAGCGASSVEPARAIDVPVREDRVAALLEQFSRDVRELAGIGLAARSCVAPRTRLVRFGALDPYHFSLLMTSAADASEDPAGAHRFNRAVYANLARFYAWLAETGRLERTRASEIGDALAKLASMSVQGEREVS